MVSRMGVSLLVVLASVACTICFGQTSSESPPIDHNEVEKRSTAIEHVVIKSRNQITQGLATIEYLPSTAERRFFAKLSLRERITGTRQDDYTLSEKDGVYVSWFGIVRQIREDRGQTTLTVEHKYFDGFTDSSIQAVSFNGSGDFQAILFGPDPQIETLELVKVYGTVSIRRRHGMPVVRAEFVRCWGIGRFCFLAAYGEDRGSDKWRSLNTADLSEIYSPEPGWNYYTERLGKREGQPEVVRKILNEVAARHSLNAASKTSIRLVIQSVFSQDYEAYQAAIADMQTNKPRSVVVDTLAQLLRVGGKSTRCFAASCLGDLPFGAEESRATSALNQALQDVSCDVRLEAAYALWRTGNNTANAMRALIASLSDPDCDNRARVAEYLENIGSDASSAVPALIRTLKDDDDYVRGTAAAALGNIGPDASDAAPALIRVLKDKDSDEYTRCMAASSLGSIGSVEVIPLLAETIRNNQSELVRSHARTATRRILRRAERRKPLKNGLSTSKRGEE